MLQRIICLLVVATVVATAVCAVRADTVLYSQSFGTDTSTTANTLTTYPEFALSAGDAIVSGGVLQLSNNYDSFHKMTRGGFAGNITVDALVGGSGINAELWASMGLQIGTARILYHPGNQANGVGSGGCFTVLLGNGTMPYGGANMGWDPAQNHLLDMKAAINATTHLFQLTVTDPGDASHVYHASWTDTSYVPGISTIGFARVCATGAAPGIGLYDNLTVTIPEPSPFMLLTSGLIGLLAYVWRKTTILVPTICQRPPAMSHRLLFLR